MDIVVSVLLVFLVCALLYLRVRREREPSRLAWRLTREAKLVYVRVRGERLASRLTHEDESIREKAVKRLLRIGKPRAIPPLAALLADARADVRESAAMVLRKLNWEPETLEHRVRYLAARHAGDEMSELLANARTEVRERVADILDQLHWEPETPKERLFYLVARQAWGELIAIGEQSIWPLLNVFAGGDRETQQAIVKAWVEKGMPHTDVLVTALHDGNLQQSAAVLLGIARAPRTVEPLIRLLRDKSLSVRENAAYVLGLIGDTSAVEALQVCWRTTDVEHLSLRRAARWALHRIDPSKSPGGEPGPVWLPWFHEIWVPKSWGKAEPQ